MAKPWEDDIFGFNDGLVNNPEYLNHVTQQISQVFPVQVGERELVLENIEVQSPEAAEDNIDKQKKAKLNGQTYSHRVVGTLALKENGKTIERKRTKLVDVPVVTRRGTVLVDGSEYSVPYLQRTKPGVYTLQKDDGSVATRFNLGWGKNFWISTGENNIVQFNVGARKIPAMPVLKRLGVSEGQLKTVFGKALYDINSRKTAGRNGNLAFLRFHDSLITDSRKNGEVDPRKAYDNLMEYFAKTKVDPEVTKRTLGAKFSSLSPKALLLAMQKFVNVTKGADKPDGDTDLSFKSIHSPAEMLGERLGLASKQIKRKFAFRLKTKPTINEIFDRKQLQKPIRSFFTQTRISGLSEDVNPIGLLSSMERLTSFGEGGITDIDQIPMRMRLLEKSQFGYVDPLYTTEGAKKVGINLHVAPINLGVNNGSLQLLTRDRKTGRRTVLSPAEAQRAIIATREQLRNVPADGKVLAMIGGNVPKKVSVNKVTHTIPAASLYNHTTLLIPFLSHNAGQRAMMGDKMLTQAVPLKHREKPLVASAASKDVSWDEIVGKRFTTLSGRLPKGEKSTKFKVVNVGKKLIQLQSVSGDKKIFSFPIHRNYPLAEGSFIDAKPTVSPGDVVTKDDPLIELNFTKDGGLALGTNLRTAYLPHKGYTFKDGVVISQSAAKKLTSMHLHKVSLPLSPTTEISKSKARALFPTHAQEFNAEHLDDNGVVKPGSTITPGSILVAAVSQGVPTTEDILLGNLSHKLKNPHKNSTLFWDEEVPGKVVDLVKRKDSLDIYIRTEEPAQVGDKLCVVGDTCVLTPGGWIPIAELSTVDSVAILDKTRTKVIFEYPQKRHKYFKPTIEEESWVLDGVYVNQEFSDKHRIFAAIDKDATEIDFDLHMISKEDNPGKLWNTVYLGALDWPALLQPSELDKDRHRYAPKSKLEFSVFWKLALLVAMDGERREDVLIIKKRPEHTPCLEKGTTDLLEKAFGNDFTNHDDGFYIDVKHPCMTDILKHCGTAQGSRSLKAPQWLLTLPTDFLAEMFVWIGILNMVSPGNSQHELKVSEKNKKTAEWLIELAFKLGWAAKIEDGDSALRVVVTQNPADSDKLARLRQVKDSKAFYGLTVSSGIFLTKRNGKISFTGNSGRYGNKSIITKIVPDDKIPYTVDENGDKHAIDLLFSPLSVITRGNPGQIFETIGGKVAKKLGTQYLAQNFSGRDPIKDLKLAMKAADVSDKEIVYDPETGNKLENKVLVGEQYVLKLKHLIRKKFAARGGSAGYDENMQPLGGLSGGAQSLDYQSIMALLTHGAENVLQEAMTHKSEWSPEFWQAVKTGQLTPRGKPTFAYRKFLAHLKGLGLTIHEPKKGEKFLQPMTDSEILKLSGGAIEDPAVMVRAKDLAPIKGGLFDRAITGGTRGGNWSHIPLSEPTPNPIFESGIKRLLGLTQSQFDNLVSGKTKVTTDGQVVPSEQEGGGIIGGAAIEYLLSRIDVDDALEKTKKQLLSAPKSKIGILSNKLRYLHGLKKAKHKPTDWMLHNLPVLPPKFRPVYPLESGDLNSSPINYGYQGVGHINRQLRNAPLLEADPELATKLRADLYKSTKALMGLGEPTVGILGSKGTQAQWRGILDIVAGTSPKKGYFQSKLLKRRQDLSARSTIGLEPDIPLDHVALPVDMAKTLYEPFVLRDLRKQGVGFLDGKKLLNSNDPMAIRTLQRIMDDHPVIMNRAPVLYKFGIMAMKPRLTTGKQIKLHPLVTIGFNADYDGDTMAVYVPVTKKAIEDAKRMLPSANLTKPGNPTRPILEPEEDLLVGLYMGTKLGKDSGKTFASPQEAIKEFNRGDLERDAVIRLKDDMGKIRETTPGRLMLEKNLPQGITIDGPLNSKSISSLIMKINQAAPNSLAKSLDAIVRHGADWAYKTGFSIGLDDFVVDSKVENAFTKILKDKSVTPDERKSKVEELLMGHLPRTNSLYIQAISGSRGKPSQIRQLLAGIGGVPGESGEIIDLGTNNLTKGLDPVSHFAAQYGSRQAVIAKSLQTSMPGESAKVAVAAMLPFRIVPDNKSDGDPGIPLSIKNNDIVGRYLAEPVNVGGKTIPQNTLITPDLVETLKVAKHKSVKVRSPLTDRTVGGVTAKSFGLREDERIPQEGENVGVLAAQTMSEPLTQMTLASFHSGEKEHKGFPAIAELLSTSVGSKPAELAPISGKAKVVKYRDGGGIISVGQYQVDIPPGTNILVKDGQTVSRGDKLSTGKINFNHMIKLKGVIPTRIYLADKLAKAYQDAGVKISRRYLETIVRQMTNFGEIEHLPESLMDELAPADVVPLTKLEALSQRHPGLKYKPLVLGMTAVPTAYKDWMDRLGYRNLKHVVQRSALEGWSSKVTGANPIAALVEGIPAISSWNPQEDD